MGLRWKRRQVELEPELLRGPSAAASPGHRHLLSPSGSPPPCPAGEAF